MTHTTTGRGRRDPHWGNKRATVGILGKIPPDQSKTAVLEDRLMGGRARGGEEGVTTKKYPGSSGATSGAAS